MHTLELVYNGKRVVHKLYKSNMLRVQPRLIFPIEYNIEFKLCSFLLQIRAERDLYDPIFSPCNEFLFSRLNLPNQ